jgi:hypothetical protein
MSAAAPVPFALPMAPHGYVWVMVPTEALKQARTRASKPRPRSPEEIEALRQKLAKAWARHTQLAAERRSARPPHEQKALERQRDRMRALRQRRKQEQQPQAAAPPGGGGGDCVARSSEVKSSRDVTA